MRLDYTLSLADYKAALRLHTRRRVSRRISHLVFIWGGPTIAVLFLIIVLICVFLVPTKFTPGFIVTLAFVVFLFLIPVMHSRSVRKQFDLIVPPSMRDRTVSIEMDNDRIITAISGSSEGKFFWNDILGFAQDETVTILYASKRRFIFIPTQAFSTAQRAEFNELVARNVVREQPC